MDEKEMQKFIEKAYKDGKVRDLQEAFLEFPPDEEWHQGKRHRKGDNRIWNIAKMQIVHTKIKATSYAETRGQSVNSIYHIDRIDDTYSSKYSKRNCNGPWNLVYTPKTIEVINTHATTINKHKNGKYLHYNTEYRRQPSKIIKSSNIQHCCHHHHNREDKGKVGHCTCHSKTAYHPHEDSYSPKHRNRTTLQFPFSRIVSQITCLGYPQYLRMYL